MSVELFLRHLAEPSPRFACFAAGTGNDDGRRIEIALTHVLNGPASSHALKRLRELVGAGHAELEQLYGVHDGLELYTQGGEGGGLLLLPISEWMPATTGFRDDFASSGRTDEDLYDFEKHGIVIGEPPYSGNVLILYQGRVHYADHDGGDDTPLADSLGELLDRVRREPAVFLYDLGCYARYSDGHSDIQWIPERYLSG